MGWLFVCCLLLLSHSVRSASIQDYVDAAVTKGLNQVTIPPGVYNTTLNKLGAHLSLVGLQGFTINAYDVVMLCTVRARALDITGCTNLTIRGLVIDYDPLTFTQGTIIAVNDDYLDLKIHAGYPVMPWPRINVVDPRTGFFKDGMGFMWDITANVSQPGVVRVYRTSQAGFYTAEVGDYATLAGGPVGNDLCHGIAVTFCENTSLIDTTIHCAPGFGLAEWGGEGGLRLDHFKIVPGPLPKGATVPRLQSSSWDGIQHLSVTRGPWVNEITVELAGDDTWSAVGDSWQILEINRTSNSIVLGGGAPYVIAVGDTLRLRNEEVYPDEEVVIQKFNMGSYPPMHITYCSICAARTLRQEFITPNFTVHVDRMPPLNWNVSDYLFSTTHQTSGFVYQNSYVRSKGRGALVKAPHGLIQNNYFYGGTAGVEVSPELDASSGSDACVGYDLTIKDNVIVHTGYHETFDDEYYGADGAIAFFSYASSNIRGPTAFRKMIVEGNTFSDVNGINIGITASDGVIVAHNTFTNTMPINYSVQGQIFGFDNGYVVFLTEDDHITLDKNVVQGEGPFKVGNLFVSKTVSNIIGENGGIIQV